MITITIDETHTLEAINRLVARMGDMTPAMQSIGEYLLGTTKRRFATSTSPDGVRWAPNAETTYLRMIERASGAVRKDGRVNAKGAGLAINKKPLIGESRSLSTQIAPQATRDSVSVGSPMIYAATQQFGAAKGAFGKDRRNHPIPWGDIPARPFIGLSDTDGDQVLTIVAEWLSQALQ